MSNVDEFTTLEDSDISVLADAAVNATKSSDPDPVPEPAPEQPAADVVAQENVDEANDAQETIVDLTTTPEDEAVDNEDAAAASAENYVSPKSPTDQASSVPPPPDSIHVPSEFEQGDPENQDLHSLSDRAGHFTPQDVQKGNNLIVNYVPRSFTDQTLYELFAPFGEIESARAIIDRQTGQCQGYGFVKFVNKEPAANAVAHFQAAAPDARQLKVHFARPSSTHKQCNIYITGLPINFTEADTAALFEPYGPVVECKILMGKDGESRGCGFVRLSDVAKTHAAITALNESVPPGGSSRISVSLAAGTRKDTMNQQYPAPGAAAYRGSPYPAAAQSYYPPQPAYSAHPYYQAAMGPYGAAARAVQPPQYGYYGAQAAAAAASAQPYARYPPTYGTDAGYAPMRHTPASRPSSTPYSSGPVITPGPVAPVPPVAPNGGRQLYTGYCLFCFNLPMEYDETALRAIFSQYGNVSSSKVMRDPATGRSKGYGFVNMDTEQQAMAAIQALNGYPLNGKTLKVQFKTHGPVKPQAGAMMGQPVQPYY